MDSTERHCCSSFVLLPSSSLLLHGRRVKTAHDIVFFPVLLVRHSVKVNPRRSTHAAAATRPCRRQLRRWRRRDSSAAAAATTTTAAAPTRKVKQVRAACSRRRRRRRHRRRTARRQRRRPKGSRRRHEGRLGLRGRRVRPRLELALVLFLLRPPLRLHAGPLLVLDGLQLLEGRNRLAELEQQPLLHRLRAVLLTLHQLHEPREVRRREHRVHVRHVHLQELLHVELVPRVLLEVQLRGVPERPVPLALVPQVEGLHGVRLHDHEAAAHGGAADAGLSAVHKLAAASLPDIQDLAVALGHKVLLAVRLLDEHVHLHQVRVRVRRVRDLTAHDRPPVRVQLGLQGLCGLCDAPVAL
eukprot:Rhum_TRINITY_DN14677_c10_g2::Rhum_TRINITY_DN14677_c10_g2_i1::g.109548::m.109548